MRILLTLCLIAFAGNSIGYSQNNKPINDLSILELKGRVKTFTETMYSIVDSLKDNIGKNPIFYTDTVSYNEKGYRIESRFFFLLFSIEKYTYKYDANGNKIEQTDYDTSGRSIGMHTYKYDEKGNKIEQIDYDTNGRSVWKYNYKYDDKENLIEVIQYLYDNFFNRKTYKYDKKMNKIEECNYFGDGSLIEKDIFKYDTKGNKIENRHYKSNGIMDKKYIYKYDEIGNKIEWTFYDQNGKLDKKYVYKYDYDKTGNWIKQTVFLQNQLYQVIVREIQYY